MLKANHRLLKQLPSGSKIDTVKRHPIPSMANVAMTNSEYPPFDWHAERRYQPNHRFQQSPKQRRWPLCLNRRKAYPLNECKENPLFGRSNGG